MFRFKIDEIVKYKKTNEELVIVNKFKDRLSNTYFCKDKNDNIDAYSENDLVNGD